MKVCYSLFNEIEIELNGDAYICCAQRITRDKLGNIFEQDFDSIWNNPRVVKMREEALKGKYPYCYTDKCDKLSNGTQIHFVNCKPEYKPVMERYPTAIAFPQGKDCNAKCIFCRNSFIHSSEEELQKLNKDLHETYMPLFKDVSTITVNDGGDAFFSKYSQELIKTIPKKYPKIQFKIMTNGICATKELIEELGLPGRILEFSISINAVKPETHYKIFRIKAWDRLLKNLTYISQLKKEADRRGHLFHYHFKFIVCRENWKEMIPFIKFAKKYGAKADFWEVRPLQLDVNYDNMSVHNPTDKHFKEFKKMLTAPEFDDPTITLSPAIIDLRNEAIKEVKNNPSYKLKLFLYNVFNKKKKTV